MDWQVKLNEAAEEYNALLAREQELEIELKNTHELRLQAFGKCHGIQVLFQEHLEDESLASSENGHGNSDQIVHPVGADEAEVE
jgi:hypothetical protein